LTHPYAINDAGTIGGSCRYGYHGFSRDGQGVFQSVDFPGASHDRVTALNDAAFAVGTNRLSGRDRGFVKLY
jgi:hypothetical protein